ncbi:AAA family ATPase [Caenimonas sp. SL110]|uniref:trifunctional serine/threonine-protein kinase/ATP-binding protein/sensor histidine kinase n=1 Tax=Caenimonas sp. SL110 TaxID=1450524 RepID=UPI0006540C6A|nr:AAA family ATPase [Caenimonas sp. SL110]
MTLYAITALPTDGDGPDETLYGSASTRIVRSADGSAAGRVIWKQHLGPLAAQRLRNEKKLLMRLEGIEGVVQLDPGAHGADILALRDCGGISLAQALQAAPLDIDTVLSLACELARTLAGVHRAGVIHRDINPANIVLCASGRALLIDFDLAVPAGQHLAVEPNSQVVGTLSYMAPEQTGRTGRAVDQRADLYALGATLYELSTGRPPFGQADPLQLIHDHLVREPVAPRQVDARVPRGLSNIILRLLAKAPEHRFQSAEGLLHDLQRLRGELEQGRSGVFELGERDFPARLTAPARLVGRDVERAVLLDAFAESMQVPGRTVLIDGPAGVGKNALIDELRPVVAAAGGWFVYGKFDQYQKDGSATGALTQALRSLGRLLLTQSGDKVEDQRQRILQRLGRHAGLVTLASPEFALLLGPQAEVPEVDPRQAELRLQQAMLDLLLAIASPECPLVVVVDDLQWAGDISLRVFERLMLDPQLRGVLLVGAYRSGEVDADHHLANMLVRWQQLARPPLRIALANLTLAGMSELAGQMLRLAPEQARKLAEDLNVLTGGNPFDTVEMINALRSDGVLRLSESGWQWDEVKVRRFIGRGNVVDLLAARISRLPAASRELLEFISCLGSAVEDQLVCAAVGLTGGELLHRLQAPLEDGLLVADQTGGHNTVNFRHDRVQQAMLGAMDHALRGQRQLAMARRLAHGRGFESEAAQQYMACVDLLDEPEEQRRAAHLFHGLARAFASAATYLLAERYLAAACALFAAVDDPRDAALRREIDTARHCALYSLGRTDEADVLYASIESRVQDPLDLIEAACLQIKSLDMRGRAHQAIALAVRLLAKLGVHVPADFSHPDREQRLDALDEWVSQDSQLDHSRRAQTTDRRLLGIYKLFGRIVGSTVSTRDLNAQAWVLLEAQRYWAEHGPCAELVGCMGNIGNMVIGVRQAYRTGYNMSRHLIAVGEALGFEVRTATARYLFASSVCPWFEPLENALDHAARAFEVMQAKGDASFACYFNFARCTVLLDAASTLERCEAQVEEGLALCRRAGNGLAGGLHMGERQLMRALLGQTRALASLDDEQFNEQAFKASAGHLPFMHFLPHRAFLALIAGDLAGLKRYGPDAMAGMQGVNFGQYRTAHSVLFVALALAWQMQRGDAGTDAEIAELESLRNWLAGRAADQPYNFLHLSLLVDAEQAWAMGDFWKAATTFDAAVVEAESRQRPWHRALITERAGLFHLDRAMTGTGRGLLARARDHYAAWGAKAKVDQMQRAHSFLQAPARSLTSQLGSSAGHSIQSSGAVSSDVLDLVGVLRASQALSSETSLERLTARVSEVLAALSGASKVLVLSCNEGQWWLLSHALDQPSMPVAQAAECGLLPLSAFAYAQRTGEALVVDDALRDDRFARDPYFAGVPVCSLLLVPIASQGLARGMLLLENRLGAAAFNAKRLDAVMLVAGQLAVSLANAQLYESLEQRVQARTRELEDTQAQLVTTARRAGMAEIANNVLHNVGNVLNSINVSTDVLRNTLGNSRIEGLTRAVELINEHEHDLSGFIETDPRGKQLWPYLNQLVGALRSEREQALGDLDRLSLGVDHIIYVVATQQAHAGPSSVLEMTQPQELIEKALHLSAETISRSGTAVVRQYEDVPASALDKQRLVQILMNLIRNAAQAMERVPAPARQLTLGIGLAQAQDGKRLRITVHDTGEGIAPENLPRLFAHGFTTRASGHGFGLHSSAVAAAEMGGKLAVHSDGPGRGATFIIDLPLQV